MADPEPSKRRLLDDSDSDSDSEDGGAAVVEPKFQVNEEFARRFEHNKKREEKQRLEEKYNKDASKYGDDDDDSSSDETEDDEGFLATEDLDAQISATLQALRSKDPRVYDEKATFYEETPDGASGPAQEKKEKPVYLRDYHREKILRGDVGASDGEDDAPQTYLAEQDSLKKTIMSEINAADAGDESSDDEGFMKKKGSAKVDSNGVHPSRAPAAKVSTIDVINADRDPETFLSNFMAARAWVPEDGGRWKAFESDDGEEDDRADQFEQAYNLRFEDPEKSNEVLKSYARDITAARSVRREEKKGRKRQRELERERKEEEKRERKEEKARLRKFKVEETEERLRKVRHAAGLSGRELTDDEWMKFLDDAWEDGKWEEEMNKRFGEEYYAVQEAGGDSDGDEDEDAAAGGKKKKPKKPKWNDDIDIKDIVPDFDDETSKPTITLSDSDEAEDADEDAEDDDAEDDDAEGDDDNAPPAKKRKANDHKRIRIESQKKARQQRAKLEALVDAKLALTDHDLLRPPPPTATTAGESSISGSGSGAAAAPGFRYRETSPQSFGLTARDILLAPSDKALNEFAGLKKLATFRDEERKRRDRKRLGKKARLRQWRRDTFGREFEREGPTYGFDRLADAEAGGEEGERRAAKEQKGRRVKKSGKGGDSKVDAVKVDGDNGDGEKKKRKRKRSKGNNEAAAAPAAVKA